MRKNERWKKQENEEKFRKPSYLAHTGVRGWLLPCPRTDAGFFKRGAPKLRTDRTLALVGTGGCASPRQRKKCCFQTQFAQFSVLFFAWGAHTKSSALYLQKKKKKKRVGASLAPTKSAPASPMLFCLSHSDQHITITYWFVLHFLHHVLLWSYK